MSKLEKIEKLTSVRLDEAFLQKSDIAAACDAYKHVYELAIKHNFLEEISKTLLEYKLHYLLVQRFDSLLFCDCLPDFLDALRMFRDNAYTPDKETNYLKLICFILEDSYLMESGAYLSDLTVITKRGLEMLQVLISPIYYDMLDSMRYHD